MPYTASNRRNRSLMTLPGWGRKVLLLAIIPVLHVLINQFHLNFRFKTLSCRKIRCVFIHVKWCFNASWGLKGLKGIWYFSTIKYILYMEKTAVKHSPVNCHRVLHLPQWVEAWGYQVDGVLIFIQHRHCSYTFWNTKFKDLSILFKDIFCAF